MKSTFALLAASTAFTVCLGLPAFSGTSLPPTPANPIASMMKGGTQALPLVLIDSDEDDDDDDEGSDDDCGEDDDDGVACGSTVNPAPTGTAAPPSNGLFGTGAPPKVQVN
ncbi:MAG: hypothetical protein U1A24_02740 [Cypionkella sp.]|uniref:hypothetical protein n=1 Tax=Cypionkella sp. TaxID=2811411 RepID=UPI002AB8DA04|nr:hypothetical protein [Cypionkella sp.]MDZ4309465.1 hypothetical protein [Cypionkella sp.]